MENSTLNDTTTSNNTVSGLVRSGVSNATGISDWQIAMTTGVVSVMLYASWKIYEQITADKPLSRVDVQRHKKLETVFTNHFHDYKIPDLWALDNKDRPQHTIGFVKMQQLAYTEAENLQHFQSTVHNVRSQIFLLIGRLFESVTKRHTVKNIFQGNLRQDGIEMMFFCHLMFWLKHCAPNYHEKDPKTLVVYRQVLEYCREACAKVITRNYGDFSRNNPNVALGRIIEIIEGYCKALKEIQDAYTFEDYNNQLRNKMLGLATHSFNLVYFVIDKTTETQLTPQRFLNPKEVEAKIINIRNTQMGEWLAQTLRMLGIRHSTFIPTKRLTHAQIKYHLINQHPEDPRFNKKKILFHWGHRPFVGSHSIWYSDNDEKSLKHLTSIRQILKLTLQIYFLLQQQTEAAKVNEVHGSVWIYGHRAGKAALTEFLNSVSWVMNALDDEINDFWKKYYRDFQEYAEQNNLAEGSGEFAPLAYMNHDVMKIIKEIKVDIERIIEKIKKQIAGFPSDDQIINQSKLVFVQDVLQFRHFIKQTNSEEFRILEEEYQKMLLSLQLAPTAIPQKLIKNRSEAGAKDDVITPHASNTETVKTLAPLSTEQLMFCREVTDLLTIPEYLISLKTSSRPRVNEYCFDDKGGVLQYTYLNQQQQEITQPVSGKDLESLGGETFKCDEERFRFYRRELLEIINPKGVIRYDYQSKFHLDLLKTKPKSFGSTSDKLKFHSKMQEEIYLKFLQEYNDVVNTDEALTYARVNNHRLLVDLYQRVNAVYHHLYGESEGNPIPALSQGEIMYIDWLLFHTIMKEFKTHQYYSGFILNKNYLQRGVEFDVEQLFVPLNGLAMDIIPKSMQHMTSGVATFIAEKEEQAQRWATEKKALEEQIAALKENNLKSIQNALLEKDEIIAELQQELRAQKTTVSIQKMQMDTKDGNIIAQNEQINSYKEQINSYKEQINSYKEQIHAKNEQSANDKKIIASLVEKEKTQQQQLESAKKKATSYATALNQLNAQLKGVNPQGRNSSGFFTQSENLGVDHVPGTNSFNL